MALALVPIVVVATLVAVEARRHAAAGGSVPVQLPAPPPPAPESVPGTARANPWPIGTAASVEGWRVKVIGVTADADAQIAQAGAVDTVPTPGYQWVSVSLHVVRSGRGRRAPSLDMAWSYVAADGRSYDARPAGLPDDLHAVGAMRHGGRANATVAFQVASSEVGDGVLSIDFSRILPADPVVRYWALS